MHGQQNIKIHSELYMVCILHSGKKRRIITFDLQL